MARRRRTSSIARRSSSGGGSTRTIVIAAPRTVARRSASRRIIAAPRAIIARGASYARRRGGFVATAKRVVALSAGGAIGTALQGTAQGLGMGPIASKALVIGAGVLLGSGAAPGSMTDAGTDGMIASVGAGVVFDLIALLRANLGGGSRKPAGT